MITFVKLEDCVNDDEYNLLEVTFFIDNDIVESYSNDNMKILDYFRNLIDYSNILLNQIKLKIVTTNFIKWDDGNYINITLNSDETITRLRNFCDKNYPYIFKSDHYSLFSTTQYYSGVVGKAYVNTVCKKCSISMILYRNEYKETAETFVHELGHALGMAHDSPEITKEDCPDTEFLCIMNSYETKSPNLKLFSKSSIKSYQANEPHMKCLKTKKKCVSKILSMKEINKEHNLNLSYFKLSEYEKEIKIQIKLDEYKRSLQNEYYSQKKNIREKEKEKLHQTVSNINLEMEKIRKDDKMRNENYNEYLKKYQEGSDKIRLLYTQIQENERRYRQEDMQFEDKLYKIEKIPITIDRDLNKNVTEKPVIKFKTNNPEKIVKTILKIDLETKVKKWRLNPFLSNNEMKQFIKFVLAAIFCLVLLIIFYFVLCCKKHSYNKIGK